ncbi:uncharacterized protein ARB_07774 [Trichophyton benhamiae CBS 112371]|uniref:Uncharacterized protein n=1 Tax=Arthroderma benhamiae (strain ATCC MYA-4681 / CBS 112371) TaxID=663331 RepID=D4ATW1_ARTBC|nr:uncharacterized protein ARB_07774 [Trichophyton benhamiae CBS 112371]EFE33414.1 hypothetical protein ARB_07774 [Trichophyton benhamiae CBS 112371]
MAMKWGKVLYDKNETQREVKKEDGKVVYRRKKEEGERGTTHSTKENGRDEGGNKGNRRKLEQNLCIYVGKVFFAKEERKDEDEKREMKKKKKKQRGGTKEKV